MELGKANKYRIFKEWNLIIIYYSGDVDISIIKKVMLKISNESDYSPKYAVINDVRDCSLKIKIDEIEKYIDYLKNELGIIESRKILFLTSKPNEVVITQLFSDNISKNSILGQVFTTSEAAMAWLSNENIDNRVFDKLIFEIKTQPNNAL